jgi:hypothetical protein
MLFVQLGESQAVLQFVLHKELSEVTEEPGAQIERPRSLILKSLELAVPQIEGNAFQSATVAQINISLANFETTSASRNEWGKLDLPRRGRGTTKSIMDHDLSVFKLEVFMEQRDSNILVDFVVDKEAANVTENIGRRRRLAFDSGECIVH